MPFIPSNPNSLIGEYQAACQEPGCPGRRVFEEHGSVGYKIGDMVSYREQDPVYGRCPLCKRHKMKIVRVPSPQPPAGPKGFWMLPDK